MAIPSTLSLPLRLGVALVALAFGACSGGGAAADPSADGSEQHIDGDNGGSGASAGKGAGSESMGGSSAEPDEGTGNTGSVGEPDENDDDPPGDEPTGGKGGGRDEPGESAGAAGGADSEPQTMEPSEAYLRGETLVKQSECVTCHQPNFAGFTVFPNITPDLETGIGSWTDAQIISAIRDGVDADGASLCVTMQRYSFSDDQASDVVAFLRGVPAVSNRLTGVCPGHGL